MEKTGCAITKLVLLGAVLVVGLLVVIGLVVGGTDDTEATDTAPTTTNTAPTTTEANAPEPTDDLDSGITTKPGEPTDPAVTVVLDVFGRCLADSGMDMFGETVTTPSPSQTVPGEQGADPVLVTFRNGAQFMVPRAPAPNGVQQGPRVNNPQAEAALDLGEANNPDCL
jgi:hypothetical protein